MSTSRPAARLLKRASLSSSSPRIQRRQPWRCLSCSASLRQEQPRAATPATEGVKTTHFGFETIPEGDKNARVGAVFSSVAASYDTMNDLMSLYVHRLWKDHFVRSLDPGINPLISSTSSQSSADGRPQPQGLNILDIAGGTGDIAFRMLDHATSVHNDTATRVTVADINTNMLAEGRKRSLATPYAHSGRLDFVEANAEMLQDIVPSSSVDLYTVVFGIRNFTDKAAALREAYRVLKPGGVFACMEFSKVNNALFEAVYKRWSFSAIPLIGQVVAGDRDSYQYLVESIEKFPPQQEFCDMIREAGFVVPSVKGANDGTEVKGWEDLTGGIAAIHRGVKPLV